MDFSFMNTKENSGKPPDEIIVGIHPETGKKVTLADLMDTDGSRRLNSAVSRYFHGRTTFIEMDSEGWL